MSSLWVFGSINTDLVTTSPRFVQPGETLTATGYAEYSGGKGANQAVALARLGGAPRMVGLLGDDDYGRRYRRVFEAEGVDSRFVGVSPGVSSGLAVIEVAASGENRILLVPGANGQVQPETLEPALGDVAAGDIALLQLELPLRTVFHALRQLKDRGATVILDPAPAVELPATLLRLVDYLTPNESEALILTGGAKPPCGDPLAAAQSLVERGVKTVILKAGAAGSYVITEAGVQKNAPYRVKPVDTTAAGDSFNAGFAFGLERGGGPVDDSLRGAGGHAHVGTADGVETDALMAAGRLRLSLAGQSTYVPLAGVRKRGKLSLCPSHFRRRYLLCC